MIKDPNLQFSRLHLSSVMIDVRKHVPTKIIKTAWTYKSGDFREFQVPRCDMFTDGVYYYTRDHNLWWVRAKGWEQALSQLGIEGYAL